MLIKYIYILQSLFLVIIFSCNTTNENNKKVSDLIAENTIKGKPEIEFKETEFDFGKIIIGEKVIHRFKYKNIGVGELKITETIAGCGCSTVKIDKNPVIANEESFIEITFDSKGFHGLQIKKVEVFTNISDEPINLIISANVEMSY